MKLLHALQFLQKKKKKKKDNISDIVYFHMNTKLFDKSQRKEVARNTYLYKSFVNYELSWFTHYTITVIYVTIDFAFDIFRDIFRSSSGIRWNKPFDRMNRIAKIKKEKICSKT